MHDEILGGWRRRLQRSPVGASSSTGPQHAAVDIRAGNKGPHEDTNVRIHGEGPYYGLLLVESSRFQPDEDRLRDYEPPLGASFQALVDITEQQRES